MNPVGFGVIGANSFVANAAVLPAIDSSTSARLIATASRSSPVPDRWAATQVADYDDVLHHPDVEAVYVPLPNGLHREWTERTAAAGKHVLCEKPIAADAPTARAMAEACSSAGVILAEAWMTPFDRRWRTALDLATTGAIGDVTAQYHRFTFTIGPDAADNYRWDRAQGGGALLDVGIYCIGTAVELWGPDCEVLHVERIRAPSGVDTTTDVHLGWPGRRTAHVSCSFVEDEQQQVSFHSDSGILMLGRAAFTSGDELDHVIVRSSTGRVPPLDLPLIGEPTKLDESTVVEQFGVEPGNPYEAMVDAFAHAVRGVVEWPRPIGRSIDLMELLDTIRDTDDA